MPLNAILKHEIGRIMNKTHYMTHLPDLGSGLLSLMLSLTPKFLLSQNPIQRVFIGPEFDSLDCSQV